MKKPSLTYIFSLKICVLFCFLSCDNSTPEPISTASVPEVKKESTATSVTIEAEDFVESDGNVKKEGNGIVLTSDQSWMIFDVNVPQAGRYKFEITANASSDDASVWVEDYIDNKDGRTYNITGTVSMPNNDEVATIDGSPLNKGLHRMKLHVNGKGSVDNFKFTLMKNHQLTPQKLTQKTDGTEWKLVWSDEFDGEGLVDETKWTYDIGNWGWGNNELQYYTEKRAKNARQEGGNLIIESHKDDMNQKWTSARLTTRGKVTFLYGKIEFKAKVPSNRGNWAAGWTLGDDYVDEISWPYCGEIDILESVGYEVNDETGDGIAHCTVHTPAYYFKINNQISSVKDIKNISGEFHTYSVEWTPTEVKGFVDGEAYYIYDKTANEKEWPFNKHQNLILNLAMGGGWGGAKGMDETMTSQQFLIDYVRVYEKQ